VSHESPKCPPDSLTEAIRAELGPHLITKKYREFMPKKAKPSWGCCYVATEALYHMWGKANGFEPVRVSYSLGTQTGSHWFLRHGLYMNHVIDLTADQFTILPPGRVPKYADAVGCGFLTKKPSKRAQQIIDAVRGKK